MTELEYETVAEIANCHAGSENYLLDLVDGVHEGGFKFIKFQFYYAHELYSSHHPRFQHFQEQSFDEDLWGRVLNKTRQAKLIPIVDIYGKDSLKLAKELGIKRIKIPATDNELDQLFTPELRSEQFDRIYFSVTGLKFYEIDKRLEWIRREEISLLNPVLVHGHQEYPTPPQRTNLSYLLKLGSRFTNRAVLGFADHSNPIEQGLSRACEVAIGSGVKYLEKHVCLERKNTTIDFHSSIERSEFKQFNSNIEKAKLIFIENLKEENIGISSYLSKAKKFPVAKSLVQKGELLTEDNLTRVRVDRTKPIIEKIRGVEKATKSLQPFQPFEFEDIVHGVTAVVVCRTDSKRLSGKALEQIAGQIPIIHLLRRVQKSEVVDNLVLATTTRSSDDLLATLVEEEGFDVYRGSEYDVLNRIICAGKRFHTGQIIRITGDDICLSYDDLDEALRFHIFGNHHYTSMKSLPSGTEAEIFEFEFLIDLYRNREADWDTEYLTFYIDELSNAEIRKADYSPTQKRKKNWRLTLDTIEDKLTLQMIFDKLTAYGKIDTYTLDDLISVVERSDVIMERALRKDKRESQTRQIREITKWNFHDR